MTLSAYQNMSEIDLSQPTPLFQQQQHAIYWLGMHEDTIFRCNTYLIVDGEEGVLVDPGGYGTFDAVGQRIEQVMPLAQLSSLIVSHQDPDIAGSLRQWLEFNPQLNVVTGPRTLVLLPYYGVKGFKTHNIEETPEYCFASGNNIQFCPAPFLHSPMTFVSYDRLSGFMFTSDIFASIDAEWQLLVHDFPRHAEKMDLFHLEYMASNKATTGFVESIQHLPINAFLPQHGSIISKPHVDLALDYLRNLHCGLDLAYPHLS